MRDGVKLAVGTLSVLPAPMPGKIDRRVAGQAMGFAPVVGLLLGGISAAVVAGVGALKPEAPLLAAVLGVVVLMALSGALHLDGLADTADGLGSRRDRETMLRIMKQSDIGPFGVASIAGVLLVDVAALTTCAQAGFGWQAILIAAVASRLTLPWSCRTSVPSARPDGLGAMVASTVRPAVAAIITAATVLCAVAFALLAAPTTRGQLLTSDGGISRMYGEGISGVYGEGLRGSAPTSGGGIWVGVEGTPATTDVNALQLLGAGLAVLVAVAVGVLVVRRARKALGGITGDVLGAAVELALPAALLTLALTT
ncbi:adenosylcobinamide-GDP ribazoletransferase [Kribbella alba]|uniref:adenosylcobinamide-GDP ribazoletransferase n=1 Tax=Kribbella alba TaxID=190197 RepID=UPI0031D74A53